MNITFFIGNGFDINLGLNTAYSSFYPYFIDKARENNMIRKWLEEDKLNWADLEKKLGEKLGEVSEDTLKQFYDDKEELDRLLIEYLEKEQKRYCFDDEESIIEEFNRSMLEFYAGMSVKDINSIEETLKMHKNEEFTYSYIDFNYTNILDKIIELYGDEKRIIGSHQGIHATRNNSIGSVLHIHGTVDEEMILGVNDESQIINDFLKEKEDFKDIFIKERMNEELGQGKIEVATNMIERSSIICVFGMSIGDTDKMWWEKLIDWLWKNSNNKLIIFSKVDEAVLEKKLPITIIPSNKEKRRELFDKGKGEWSDGHYEGFAPRILISNNANIFSLPKVKNDDKKKE